MNKLKPISNIMLLVFFFVLLFAPKVAEYKWKDSHSPLQFFVIMLVAVLVLGFWLWVNANTVNIIKLKGRQKDYD